MHARLKHAAAHTLDESVEQIAHAAGDATAIGVIVPGIYAANTGRAWCPNLWGSSEVPLRAALEARVGMPIAIDCDRAGYVAGESWLSAARGLAAPARIPNSHALNREPAVVADTMSVMVRTLRTRWPGSTSATARRS